MFLHGRNCIFQAMMRKKCATKIILSLQNCILLGSYTNMDSVKLKFIHNFSGNLKNAMQTRKKIEAEKPNVPRPHQFVYLEFITHALCCLL